jgi:hypothetical protein
MQPWEPDFLGLQVDDAAGGGDCNDVVPTGVRIEGESEFRLAAGHGVPTSAGEVEESRCYPGTAFEHQQVGMESLGQWRLTGSFAEFV